MENKTQQQLDELESKVAAIFTSVKKTERYMQITFWATIVLVVLPAVLLAIALPGIIASYSAALEGLV